MRSGEGFLLLTAVILALSYNANLMFGFKCKAALRFWKMIECGYKNKLSGVMGGAGIFGVFTPHVAPHAPH